MTPRDGGLPHQDPLWVAPICAEPSLLQLGTDPLHPEDPRPRLAYAVCFRSSEMFVVDTALGRVVDQVLTGRGPNGIAIDGKNRRAFVANFLDNTIGVIDLDPSHTSYNRMVLRIGTVTALVHQ